MALGAQVPDAVPAVDPNMLLWERRAKIQAHVDNKAQTWRFGGQGITNDGARLFAKALDEHPFITSLDLTDNEIGPAGAAALAQSLANNNSLTALRLFGNQIGIEGTAYLCSALENNKKLMSLDVASNQIGDKGALCLAKMLQTNRTLRKIDAGGNGITDSANRTLQEAANKSGVEDLKLWEVYQDMSLKAVSEA
uniref:Uncharacterized protein n=1 Tax=Eutreptiella gymnastica TaxID=73025 RepID=A0A7S1IA12_9EUGL